MALYRIGPEEFVGRKRPENTIFTAKMALGQRKLKLVDLQTILSKEEYPLTHEGRKVVGFEDPTYLSPTSNPFGREPAILCTQTFEHDGEYGKTAAGEPLATNLAYFSLGRKDAPVPVITPKMLQEAGLGEHVSMIKEAELVSEPDSDRLLFEFVYNPPDGVGKRAYIGAGRIELGRFTRLAKYLEPLTRGFINLSTCGPNISLDNGKNVLFLNATTAEREWGITYMDLDTMEISPLLAIRAPLAMGRGYGNQRIAFGSFAEKLGDGRVAVYYHVNDISSHIAYLTAAG